jgi:hypothetical protein
MQAVSSHAFAVLAEHGVGLGRPITRNDLEGSAGARLSLEGVQDVEKAFVDSMLLARTKVAEKMLDRSERVGQISPALVIL